MKKSTCAFVVLGAVVTWFGTGLATEAPTLRKEWWTAGAQVRRSEALQAKQADSGAVASGGSGSAIKALYTSEKLHPPPPQQAVSPAPAPVKDGNPDAYDPKAGAWDVIYSAADIQRQQKSGAQLMQNISNALDAGKRAFTIPPGVYRLNDQISFADTINFTLNAGNVELIVEGPSLHFQLSNNTNFTISGPLILDAALIGFSQGRVVDTDNATYILYQLMTGYQPPSEGVRIMCFDQDSNMLPLYQVDTQTVTEVSPGLYNITMPDYFWGTYVSAREQATAVGNYMAIETGMLSGGLNMNSNNGIKISQVAIHSSSLIFGLHERGPVVLDGIRGVRRPGTNRLAAGGFAAVNLQGGSFRMMNSELSFNFDDLTDIQNALSYAWNPISPTQVYIGYRDMDNPQRPQLLSFYNLETLEEDGIAKAVDIQPVEDQSIVAAFQNGLTDLGLLNWNVTPVLVTLDRPINMTSTYDLVDDHEARAKEIVFENCYMHDSLASGINAKGAQQILIRNNTVVRAGYRGAAVGYDPYWWEGGVPANIIIENNIIDSVPYLVERPSQAICTYVDSSGELMEVATAAAIHNVTIRNNTVVNPAVAGIGLTFAANNEIVGNTISNPTARIADQGQDYSQPYADSAAIFLDTVGGTTNVHSNTIINAFPQLVPQLLRISAATDPHGITLCSNTEVSGDGQTQLIADEFWTSVTSNDSMVTYSPRSDDIPSDSFAAFGSRLESTFAFNRLTSPNDSATFSFTGTRARWYSCLGPPYGLAAVYLDGEEVATVDASLNSLPDVNPLDGVGFCSQMVFDSMPVPFGKHTLEVVVTGNSGNESDDGEIAVAIDGFDFLTGTSLCHDPAPAPAPARVPAPRPAAAFGAPLPTPQRPAPVPAFGVAHAPAPRRMAAAPVTALGNPPETAPQSSVKTPPPDPPFMHRVVPTVDDRSSTTFVATSG